MLALALCGCASERPAVTRYGWPTFGIAPESPRPALIVEVGNHEHCRDVWAWPSWRLGDCRPYDGFIRVRAAGKDASGRQVPRLETLGHEVWHLNGWGGQWHQ